MRFVDRADAGRRLAERLGEQLGERLGGRRGEVVGSDVVVLGLPRGGVPVAFEVARSLGVPLDVIVVRKLGVPFQPELAMGAIGEDGARTLNEAVLAATGVDEQELQAVEAQERAELERRARRFRQDRPRVDLRGRTALIVDDGIATGSTARAACQVARAQGAARVIMAVPVAPAGADQRFAGAADELVVVTAPRHFDAVGQFYDDFSQTTDDEVVDLLARASRPLPNVSEEPNPGD